LTSLLPKCKKHCPLCCPLPIIPRSDLALRWLSESVQFEVGKVIGSMLLDVHPVPSSRVRWSGRSRTCSVVRTVDITLFQVEALCKVRLQCSAILW
jgi:hypothetical protein